MSIRTDMFISSHGSRDRVTIHRKNRTITLITDISVNAYRQQSKKKSGLRIGLPKITYNSRINMNDKIAISSWTTYKKQHQREFPNNRRKYSVHNELIERGFTHLKSMNITNKFAGRTPKKIVNMYLKNAEDISEAIFYAHKSLTVSDDLYLDIYVR